MQNDELDRLAPTLYGQAMPSETLRARVLAATPVPRRQPQALRWSLAGGGLVAAGVLVVLALPRPRPAYADLQKAMETIKTARWESRTEYWNPGEHTQHTSQHLASLTTPALVLRSSSGDISLETPQASLSYDHRRALYLKDKPSTAETLRKSILESFFPPLKGSTPNSPASPYRWTPWRVETVLLDGVSVYRFSHECRYQREAYSETVWADKTTRRLVRRESEMSWKGFRSKTTATNFRYDIDLPADALTLRVPKGKSVFVNDHHFYPGARQVTPTIQEQGELAQLLRGLDAGWGQRRFALFAQAFDFTYLPTLYNGIISPAPQKRAAQQEAYWRNRLAQAAKLRPRWDHWESSLVSVEEQPGVRIQGMPPFCLREGDPAIWKAEISVRCDTKQGAYPIDNATLHYTLWLRRVGGTFRVIYAELNDTLGIDALPPPRLFD